MTVKFYPTALKGTVFGMSSKSHLHRILFCAGLSKGSTRVYCNTISKDISATLSALSALGKGFEAGDGYIDIFDTAPSDSINVNESGTTFRFVLPILSAACDRTVEITGSDYLASRPISPLYEQLLQHGAVISEKGKFPLITKGGLKSGAFVLPGNISSQFVSGLLLALPICDGDSEIKIEGVLQSKPYVDMTVECQKMFGVSVEEMTDGYKISGNQKYVCPDKIICENDWSNAAFFLTAGALSNEEVGVEGLNIKTYQGDSEILRILEDFGAKSDVLGSTVSFKNAPLTAITLNASNIPDLVPIVSLAAAVAKGNTVISGAERLRFKESDRLHSVTTVLNLLGADVKETPDGLSIFGKEKLSGGTVPSFNDHRIAMTAAIASCVCENPVIITGFEAINKSYPAFLEDFKKVGGRFEIMDNA